jgi:hypothetical protein
VPEHHRSADKVKSPDRYQRHWKMKMWKRRSTVRRAKAQAFRLAGQ